MPTKFRGVQLSPNRTQVDVDAAINNGVNLLRFQLTNLGPVNNVNNDAGYKFWIDHELNIAEPIFKNVKTKANCIIDFHTPPGGFSYDKAFMFNGGSQFINTFLDTWEITANRYKNRDEVFAYDLLNEPAGSVKQVKDLMLAAHTRIRKIDTEKKIIIAMPYTDVSKFAYMPFIKGDPHVWYTAHMYYPMGLTHQGIGTRAAGNTYPNSKVKKDDLVKYLKPARDFQIKNRAKIYVGEFSCSAYASVQTRKNYLKDCIDIFEDYGWHWTYHAHREASVWDIEPYTQLITMFKNYWARNTGL